MDDWWSAADFLFCHTPAFPIVVYYNVIHYSSPITFITGLLWQNTFTFHRKEVQQPGHIVSPAGRWAGSLAALLADWPPVLVWSAAVLF